MYSGCSLEAFDGCLCLFVGDIIRGCVLTLKVIWMLLFCFNVFDCSLFIVLIVWVMSAHFWEMSEFPTFVALLAWGLAFLSCLVKPWAAVSTCSLGTVSVVSLGPGSSHATPVAGSPTSEQASMVLSAPEACPGAHLWKLGYLVHWCTVCVVCRLWSEGLYLSACCILWHILMHSLRVRPEPLEIHCW